VLALESSNKNWVLAAHVPGLGQLKAKQVIAPKADSLEVAIENYRRRAASGQIGLHRRRSSLLLAWLRGEPRVSSMVPIPDEADEDARRPLREREELMRERISLTNRIGAHSCRSGRRLANRCRSPPKRKSFAALIGWSW
jgi:transposase